MKMVSIGSINLGINYSVLTRRNEMNSDRIPKILGWKTIRLIPEIMIGQIVTEFDRIFQHLNE